MVQPKSMDRQVVRNLYQFLTLLRDGYRPFIEDQNVVIGRSLEQACDSAQAAMQKLIVTIEGSDDQEAKGSGATVKLMEYLTFVVSSVKTGNGGLIDTAYARKALKSDDEMAAFKDAWIYLFNLDFEASVALQSSLVRMFDLLDATR